MVIPVVIMTVMVIMVVAAAAGAAVMLVMVAAAAVMADLVWGSVGPPLHRCGRLVGVMGVRSFRKLG